MTKRALTILVVAVLIVGGAAAVIASSLSGGDSGAMHTMPSGQTMNGDSMGDSQMTVPGGSSMDSSDMDK